MFKDFNFDRVIYAVIYVVVAVIFYFILTRITKALLRKPREKLGDKLTARQIQRMSTLEGLINSALKYIVILALILALLANFGVDVSSLLAGLGIVTAVIGLAFQDFGKDIIAGFSIIMDKLYEVGDLIEVDGFKGRVTSVGMKTTKVKNYRGKELTIANRNMTSVINYSAHNTLAEVDLPVSYEADSDHVEKVLEKVCADLKENPELEEYIVGDVTCYGPIQIDDSAIVWRVNAECAPYKHFKPQRAIRRLALKEFKKAGIKVPYKQVEVHNGK